VSERRLRRDVDRFSGCLDALPGVEGPLLAIRAGIGSAAPASLSDAARRLGISTRRATRVQRRGLRHLRAAGRSGACGAGASAARRSVALGTAGGAVPQLQPAVLLAPRPSLTSPAMLAEPSNRRGPAKLRIARPGTTGEATEARAPATVHTASASTKTASYLAALGILALLAMALVVAWRRREQTTPARLAEQTGTAAVWWPPARPELPPGPAEPPMVAAEVVELDPTAEVSGGAARAPSDPGSGADRSSEGPAPVSPGAPAPTAAHRRRPGPAAVAAASVVSLGLALLRRRRR
jgi:MYXO-CTERM domain-containing protein